MAVALLILSSFVTAAVVIQTENNEEATTGERIVPSESVEDDSLQECFETEIDGKQVEICEFPTIDEPIEDTPPTNGALNNSVEKEEGGYLVDTENGTPFRVDRFGKYILDHPEEYIRKNTSSTIARNETEESFNIPENENTAYKLQKLKEREEAEEVQEQVEETLPELVEEPREEVEEILPEVVEEEITTGLFYNIRSSIFKWFQKTTESIKSIFVRNVETYENESEKNSEYLSKRNDNLKKSLGDNDEPPFDGTICLNLDIDPVGDAADFCSCGDGICASYEDKCNCEKDCGSCPEGTICKRGECLEYVEDTCMNTICEEGENETCPWDCKIYMQDEEEEITEEPQEEIEETLPELAE